MPAHPLRDISWTRGGPGLHVDGSGGRPCPRVVGGPGGGGWTAWGAASSGREQQLTARAHVTVETPAIQLDGNCWKFLHGTSQGAAIAPATAAPSAGGPGQSGGPPRRPSVSGQVWEDTCRSQGQQPLGLDVGRWQPPCSQLRPPPVPGGAAGAHTRAAADARTTKLPRFPSRGSPGHPCRTGTQVSHLPWAPKGSQGHALLSLASATELKTKRPPAGSL